MNTEVTKLIAGSTCGPHSSAIERFQFRATGPKIRRYRWRHTVTLRSYTTRDKLEIVNDEYADEYTALEAHITWMEDRHVGCTGSGCLVPPLQAGASGEGQPGAG